MGYPNLKAEMGRFGVTKRELAECAEVTYTTMNSWFKDESGSDFPIYIAKRLRDRFFPGLTLDYLFADEPIVYTKEGQQNPSGETA